ncbi:MAG: glycosyltransferase [Leeuwenhoekiella sp.]
MRLSIVIPLYNSEKFIKPCVESLIAQNLDPASHEIIIIDDGSKDGSYEQVVELEKMHPSVKGYRKENGGAGDARNFGMDKASGKYLYFLDVDDYLANGTLSLILNTIEQNNLDLLCFDSIKTTDGNLKNPTYKESATSLDIMDGISYIAKKDFDFEVWRYIIDLEFLRSTNIRFKTDSILEDSYFTVHLFIEAQRMARVAIDAHRYVQQPDSITYKPGREHAQRMLDDLIKLAEHYEGLIQKYNGIDHHQKAAFLKQLQAKKEFFVYYYTVRAYNGNFDFSEVWKTLQRMKVIDAYPFRAITHREDKFAERLQYIFNRKLTLFGLFTTVRPLQNLKKKLRS